MNNVLSFKQVNKVVGVAYNFTTMNCKMQCLIDHIGKKTLHVYFPSENINELELILQTEFLKKLSEVLVTNNSYALFVNNVLSDISLFDNREIHPNIFLVKHGTLIQLKKHLGVVLSGGLSANSNYYLKNNQYLKQYIENNIIDFDKTKSLAYYTNANIIDELKPYVNDISFVITNSIPNLNINVKDDKISAYWLEILQIYNNRTKFFNDNIKEYINKLGEFYAYFINSLTQKDVYIFSSIIKMNNFVNLELNDNDKTIHFNNCMLSIRYLDFDFKKKNNEPKQKVKGKAVPKMVLDEFDLCDVF